MTREQQEKAKSLSIVARSHNYTTVGNSDVRGMKCRLMGKMKRMKMCFQRTLPRMSPSP